MNFLNISIITYNDLENLKRQLDIISSIILPSDVNVYVYDNCSDYDIFKELSSYVNVKIHRHPANIGADLNIFCALKSSKSIWTWVLSTNDFIKVELLLDLISEIRNLKSAGLFLHSKKEGELFELENLKYFQEKYERLFHISSIIFNTKLINTKLDLYDKYIVTQQAQFFFLLELFIENGSLYSFYFLKVNIFSITSPPEWNKTKFLNSNFKILEILSLNQLYELKKKYGNFFLRTYLMIIYLGYKDDMFFKGFYFLNKMFKVYFRPTYNSYILIYPLLLILKIKIKNLISSILLLKNE